MTRYCLKPRTRRDIERAAAALASSSVLSRFEKRGAISHGRVVTPKWAHLYLSLKCIRHMTPAQARRDLAAHLKRWQAGAEAWGRGPGASDLGRATGRADSWEG